jgi:two-component system, LytTR family, sensor kinase
LQNTITIKRFLLLQLVCWVLYAGIAIYAFGNGIETAQQALAGFLMLFIPGFTITTLYRQYLRKYKTDFLSIKKIIPVILLVLLIHFTVIISLQLIYNRVYSKDDLFQGSGFLVYATSVFIVVVIMHLPWYFIYHIYKYITALHNKEMEAARYREENTKLQIENLTNKLNPHFLFNTLNTIRWLTGKDNIEARNAINDLSEILRYNLTNLGRELIPLKEELAIAGKYLSFEKIRFEERLEYAVSCPEEANDCRVVPFTILNLVENSIKHGISQLPGGGSIAITVTLQDAYLNIEVANSGRITDPKADGFGISSLHSILNHYYSNNSSIQIENSSENEVVAKIKIPIK